MPDKDINVVPVRGDFSRLQNAYEILCQALRETYNMLQTDGYTSELGRDKMLAMLRHSLAEARRMREGR